MKGILSFLPKLVLPPLDHEHIEDQKRIIRC